MRAALRQLRAGEDLGRTAVTAVFSEIMAGQCAPSQVGALLMGLGLKGETIEEIVGAAIAMREAVTPVRTERAPLLDTCGTGGSGIPRRNVSTAVAIVAAACGVAVAKHGNRAASSRSGSADVLEALGVAIDAPAPTVGHCVDACGVGFLFAAALHPAMKHAMGPRRALGIPTIFNVLGPLTNPASATRQLLGVYDPRRCEPLAAALGALGSERVWVVHGFGAGVSASPDADRGIDDLSPEGETWVAQWRAGRVDTFVVRPEDAGIAPFAWSEIAGGSPAENAEALQAVLSGAPGPYRQAVVYSGAAALLVAGEHEIDALPQLATVVEDALDSGAAAATLASLVETSNQA